MTGPLIELRGVRKTFPLGEREVTVLDDVSLTVERGEFVAIVGASGSGKSTLLNMITGIDRPTAGEVRVAGTALHELDENRLAIWRGEHVGVVFQFFQLLPALTLLQNVVLPMDFAGRLGAKERRERAEALLARVGLTAHADQLPGTVSGGQQQRAAIARALANDPPLLVADEPTGNLDSRTADEVLAVLDALRGDGRTIVLVTHAPDLAERADRVVRVVDGRVASDGPSAPPPPAPGAPA
jgi:putative ABC transport system ATP-binding protein